MIRVLMLARDLESTGGVANFTKILKGRLSKETQLIHHQIGFRVGCKSSLKRIFFPVLDTVRLLHTANRDHVDIIHLNPSLNPKSLLRDSFFLISILCLSKMRNIVVFFRGWDLETERIIRGNRFLRVMFCTLFSRVPLILVLGSVFSRSLKEIGLLERRIETFTTMFDGAIFQGINVERDETSKSLLFLSRLVSEKGIYELLEAFAQLSKRFPDLRLVIAGDGPEKDTIEHKIIDYGLLHRVQVLGYIRGEDKGRALMSADIYVLPTYYGEGLPNSLLEAMAAGLAVITTPVGGIPDIIKNGKNAILLNKVTSDTIASAIEMLLTDDELCQRIKKTNQEEAWNNYEASIVARKIETLYKSLLDHESRT